MAAGQPIELLAASKLTYLAKAWRLGYDNFPLIQLEIVGRI